MSRINIKSPLNIFVFLLLSIFCLTTILGTSINIFAASAVTETTISGVTYKYSSNTLTITGTGTVTKEWQTKLKQSNGTSYVTSVKTVVFNSTEIKGVNSNSFSGCTNWKTVNFKAYNGGNLNTTAFENNTQLTTIYLSGITSVGDNAFNGCTSAKVSSYNNVTSIGASAFKNTVFSTGSITLNATIGNNAFEGTSITGVTFNSGVTSVGSSAFNKCSSLKSVTLNCNSLSSLPSNTFSNCSILATVDVKYFNNGNFNTTAFQGKSTITKVNLSSSVNSITKIGSAVFKNCSSLSSLTFSTAITEIGSEAFYNTAITSLSLSTNVPNLVTVNSNAFASCSSLKTVTINTTTLVTLSESTFSGTDLTKVSISKYTNNNFNSLAFKGKSSITSISLGSSLTSLGDNIFQGVGITSITLPSGLTYLGEGAFKGAKSLTSITIPAGLTTINKETFNGCSALTTVTFNSQASSSSKLTSIKDNAFSDCGNLTTFNLPYSLKTLGLDVFKNDSNLVHMIIYSASPESFGNNLGDYIVGTKSGDTTTYNIKTRLSSNSIKDVVIASTCTEIPDFAFVNNTRVQFIRYTSPSSSKVPSTDSAILTSKSIISSGASKVTTIGNYAFTGCKNLKTAYFSTKVTSIGVRAYDTHNSFESGVTQTDDESTISANSIKLTVSHKVEATDTYEDSGIAKVSVNVDFAGASSEVVFPAQDYIFILDLTGSMDGNVSYYLGNDTKRTNENKMVVSGRVFEQLLDTLQKESPDSRIAVIGYYGSRGVLLSDWESYTKNKFEHAYSVAKVMQAGKFEGDLCNKVVGNGGSIIDYCSASGAGGTDYRVGILATLNFLIDKGYNYNNVNAFFMSDGGHTGGDTTAVKAFAKNLSAFAHNVYAVGVCVEYDTVDTTIDYSNFTQHKNGKYVDYITVAGSERYYVDADEGQNGLPDCYVTHLDKSGGVTSVTYSKASVSGAYNNSYLSMVSAYNKYYNIANGTSVYNDFRTIFMRFIATSTSSISGITAYDLFNTTYWEFIPSTETSYDYSSPFDVNYDTDIAKGAFVSMDTGVIYDATNDTFIANTGETSFYFYVRLKEPYRNKNSDKYLVTKDARVDALVANNGQLATVSVHDTTPYYLPWKVKYYIQYDKGLTNNS
jgi:hypothetical protein